MMLRCRSIYMIVMTFMYVSSKPSPHNLDIVREIKDDIEYRASRKTVSPPRYSWSSEVEEEDGFSRRSKRFAATMNSSILEDIENFGSEWYSCPQSSSSDVSSHSSSFNSESEDNEDLKWFLRHNNTSLNQLSVDTVYSPEHQHVPAIKAIVEPPFDEVGGAFGVRPLQKGHARDTRLAIGGSILLGGDVQRQRRPCPPLSFERPNYSEAPPPDPGPTAEWTTRDLILGDAAPPAESLSGPDSWADSATARRGLHGSALAHRALRGLKDREAALAWAAKHRRRRGPGEPGKEDPAAGQGVAGRGDQGLLSDAGLKGPGVEGEKGLMKRLLPDDADGPEVADEGEQRSEEEPAPVPADLKVEQVA